MRQTRLDTEISLIGNETPEIRGNQFPSKKQILEFFFHYTRHATPKLTAREAARCVVRKCAIFWEYAEIQIIKQCNASDKLEKLVREYRNVCKKGPVRREKSINAQIKVIDFKCMLDDLFDIAHQKQVEVMKNGTARIFLGLQRQMGRKGYLNQIIDTANWGFPSEEEGAHSLEKVKPRRILANSSNYQWDDDEVLAELFNQFEDNDATDSDFQCSLRPSKLRKLNIMTPDLTAILDRAKVSDRMAVRVLAAALITVGVTLEDVHVSRETIRRKRQIQRKSLSGTIKNNIKNGCSSFITVHWDSKLVPAIENIFEKIDRLSILISGSGGDQLLGVPQIKRGTGEEQANAIFECLKEWESVDDICAMVFDTTASNTGSTNGACFQLERLLGRNLLHLVCRHHVLELLLKSAFETFMGPTSGPDISIFKRFQGQWKNIEKGSFSPGVQDADAEAAVKDDIQEALAFAYSCLKINNIRKDYREFLELVIMFLGGNLQNGNRFRALGPIHHARWMAKAIYSLKIFVFTEQFYMTSHEISGLRNVYIFVVSLYQKSWFTASNTVEAPKNDLELLKRLTADPSIPSSKVCNAVFEKFGNHLWYLSEELIALAFFDENLDVDCKRKMCEAIKCRPALKNDRRKRKSRMKDRKFIQESDLDGFVTQNTIEFFKILNLDSHCWDVDPTTWAQREDYMKASKIVRSLLVTNDVAERRVALVSEYNDLLTKSENSKQDVLLVVKKLREFTAGCTKETLKFSLEDYLNNSSVDIVSDTK
ncbi:uncharacterized protein LOC135164717 [Diachasmimorpha longicaudata]|uniref:uncharacterized protein LOC135164717 n=1 Tax=Diachasmimorpha longicaudata TaxID=58733 RepID=UPI0030B886AA